MKTDLLSGQAVSPAHSLNNFSISSESIPCPCAIITFYKEYLFTADGLSS